MTAALTEDVPRSMPRSTAGNLHEGFGGQVHQMQGAAEHVRERIRNTRPSARRRRRRRWGAWAPKHRGGFPAGLLGYLDVDLHVLTRSRGRESVGDLDERERRGHDPVSLDHALADEL